MIGSVVAAILAVAATVFMVATTIALWRAPDALSRANVLSIMGGVVLPFMIAAHLAHDWSVRGFDLNNFVRALLAITALLVVASVASFTMGRSLFQTSREDPKDDAL